MPTELQVYNTLARKKELFQPLNPPQVGMYVCGPTVYGEAHLGHARANIVFDVIFRYLTHLGYKVRYVRNITDVGHLEADSDDGEDKIEKKAKLERVEPMEIVQQFSASFHQDMQSLNILPPSIEPRASGHILEQIEMIETILGNGFAYEVDGSVYFDVPKYHQTKHYGKLSGRIVEDLLSGTRDLAGQEEKKSPLDFALWKKATPEHIMKWKSPWSEGYPGWHLECSAMSTKYLGEQFDIHGGGMDLLFPHHDCEIAQTQSCYGTDQARYWIHNNLITIEGQKMGKSLGNFITLKELFSGSHPKIGRIISPMTVRLFILQAHYRSTLDFSIEALDAAKKGYNKMINGLKTVKALEYKEDPAAQLNEKVISQINGLVDNCFRAMNDDFNTALTIGHLFNLLKKINSIHTQDLSTAELGEEVFSRLKNTYVQFVEDILGITEEKAIAQENMLNIILGQYSQAKSSKDYDNVDLIRAQLKTLGIVLKDSKAGVDWGYEE